jgi:hypothetical protein
MEWGRPFAPIMLGQRSRRARSDAIAVNSIELSQWTTNANPNTTYVEVGAASYWVQNANRPYSLTNPGGDNSTLRFELRPGDVWAAIDPPRKERSEISGATTFAQGTDIHVSYQWRLEPGPANDAKWLVAGQFHQANEGGLSPPFAINMVGDRMAVTIDTSGNDAESYGNYRAIYRDAQSITRGRDYVMQIDAIFDPVEGYVRVIRDGVILVDYHGPLGYAGMGAVYWKQGVYRSASSTSIAMTYSGLKVSAGASATPSSASFSRNPPTSASTP